MVLSVSCSSNKMAAHGNQSDNYRSSMEWGGLKRTFLTHIPPSYDKTRPMPLVIVLHGAGGTAFGMVKLTKSGFNTLADKDGFIVIYPNGIEKRWNDGRSSDETKYRKHSDKIDDVGFISALIDNQFRELNIDRKRVYVTGISNGAAMSHRLGCELSDKIAAIAPVAGNISQHLLPECSPAQPISVLVINGVNDPVVPWEGGDITRSFGKKKIGKMLSTAATIDYWRNRNKCSSVTVGSDEPDRAPRDGTTVQKKTFSECEGNTEVVLYTIEGGGHTWPGGIQYLPRKIVGNTCRDINANEVIWGFFKRHSR
jgi:polyhydroxybutyrate depolymerase